MFTIKATDGKARVGVLTLSCGGTPIDTPALLIYSHRGSPLNLTPDLLEKLKPDVQGVQLDVLQFLNQPKPEVLRSYSGAARAFFALDRGYALVATARDPAVYEYSGAMRQATNQWASVTVHTGALCVTPALYIESVRALAPDVWVALSDDVPSDSRSERCPKAVDRTLAWLKECLQLAAAAPELAGSAAFAAVQGGQYLHERRRCAQAVAAQPGVAGFVVAGLGTGDSPTQRRQLLEAVLPELPQGKPRMLSTVGAPEEVLEAVAQGMDMFDGDYVAALTAGGYALTFPVSPEAERQQAQQQQQQRAPASVSSAGLDCVEGADCGRDDSKMSLWALAHRTDRRPLRPGCACFACKNHSRAYIHHLLQAHEMTAQVLLELHNTHHYLQFFKAVRAAIAAGGFAAYHDWFLQRRQRWLLGQQLGPGT